MQSGMALSYWPLVNTRQPLDTCETELNVWLNNDLIVYAILEYYLCLDDLEEHTHFSFDASFWILAGFWILDTKHH